MIFAAKSITGIREQNQDCVAYPISSGCAAIVAVADGMGGHNAGNVASSLAIEALLNSLDSSTPGTAAERLINAVNMANSAVYERALTIPEYKGMGTTLVAAFVKKTGYIAVNVGDSRLYQFNGKELKQITKDHSYVAQLVELGIITKEEAKHHSHRNIITRALGTCPCEKVDVFECDWNENDILLLCSDGLYNAVDDISLEALLSDEYESLQQLCDKLVRLAYERGSTDNISAVLVCNKGEEGK